MDLYATWGLLSCKRSNPDPTDTSLWCQRYISTMDSMRTIVYNCNLCTILLAEGSTGRLPYLMICLHVRSCEIPAGGFAFKVVLKFHCCLNNITLCRFNRKMSYYQYRKSHCVGKTILGPFYPHNGIFYTGKTTSLYWIRAQTCNVFLQNLDVEYMYCLWNGSVDLRLCKILR